MSIYSVKHISSSSANIKAWALDIPVHGAEATIVHGRLNILGWAISHQNMTLHLVVKYNNQTYSYPFSVARPDVIRAVFQEPAELHSHLRCGFSVQIIAAAEIKLGFEHDGLIEWMATLTRAQ